MLIKEFSLAKPNLIMLGFISVFLHGCGRPDSLGKSFSSYESSVLRGAGIPGVNPIPTKGPIAGPTPTPTPGAGSAGDGVIDADCMKNKGYNACVFFKNPVAQKGASIPGLSYSTDLSALQIYGVNLTGLNSSGYLENQSILVKATSGQRAKVNSEGEWKFVYKNDSDHRVSQVMAYYWLNFQIDHMVKRTGSMFVQGKKIIVDAFNTGVSNNAYWSDDEKKVVMGVFTFSGAATEAALSAEIFIHEMAHANLTYANNSASKVDENAYGCSCMSAGGCSSAINEGQADFHAAIIFPKNPALGESAFNSLTGIEESGLPRDVNKLKDLTAQNAYNMSGGECHVMGRVYAGIWWEVYKSRSSDDEKKDLEKVFSEHLKVLTGADKFAEARDKIISIDKSLFGSKYGSLFTAEFKRRGIN